MSLQACNYKKLPMNERIEKILERSTNREYFFSIAIKMIGICLLKGIRIIMENPWAEQTFLKANFIQAPSVIDNNRMMRGDFFVKPTAYWFFSMAFLSLLSINPSSVPDLSICFMILHSGYLGTEKPGFPPAKSVKYV